MGALGSPGDVGMDQLVIFLGFTWEISMGRRKGEDQTMKSLEDLGRKNNGHPGILPHFMIHRDEICSWSIACGFRKGGPATQTPVMTNDLVAVDHRISEVHDIPMVGQFLPNPMATLW